MDLDKLKRFRILIVPGLHDSGPQHWQTRWQQRFPAFERVEQRHWDSPDIEQWTRQLACMLRRSARPTLVIAHSFGCLAAVRCAMAGARNLAGMLLVAPADPEKFGLSALLDQASLPCPATVVASEDDPWMAADRAASWAQRWDADFISAGRLGHINAESGLGEWEQGWAQLERLLQRLPDARNCACGGAVEASAGAGAG
jgi:predicted alpha/beta hydrolase family esterase